MSTTITQTVSAAQLDQPSVDTIRFLLVDAVQKANSGHPGLPLGAAAMAYVLWTRFLQHSPAIPQCCNRDRFVLSVRHNSMLLSSLLHLTGYDLPAEQIKHFRQWRSIAPAVFSGKRTLHTAHGSSLRVLVKHLDGVSDADIVELNIPTGIPLVYELNEQWKPIRRCYLGDAAPVHKTMQAVATQASLQGSP